MTTHIPFIGSIPYMKNQRIKTLVQNLDLSPTLFGLAGIKIPSNIQGKNLLPWIQGNKFAKHNDFVYSQLGPNPKLASIKNHSWSYYHDMLNMSVRDELYAINLDPLEQNNVIAKYPEIAKQLKTALLKQVAETDATTR